MSVAGAAYAISTAPFFPMGSFGWNSPFVVLSMGFPVVFWLWAHAIFDEDFALRPWHGVLWALVAGLGLMAYDGWSQWPDLAATCSRLLALASIGFALLAAAQIPRGWRAGALTGRTSLLIALVVGITIHVVLTAASGLAAIPLKSMSLTDGRRRKPSLRSDHADDAQLRRDTCGCTHRHKGAFDGFRGIDAA
jgi:hypothetical protein